jgi:hypothetical protein
VNVNDVTIELRRRKPYEAIDLGSAMLHRWRGPALAAWMLLYWPCGLFATLCCFIDSDVGKYVPFLLWWLKPWFDRVLLHFFSRAVFGEVLGARECVRAAFAALRTRALWGDLTFRRLSAARSFTMPVATLEGQVGVARRKRVSTLMRAGSGSAVGLTVVCANIVAIVELTLGAFALALIPGQSGIPWADLVNGVQHASSLVGAISCLVVMTAETLVEPYYVAAGFSLYLSRRTELEGWDLELAFLRIGARLRASGVVVSGALAGAFLTGALWLGLAGLSLPQQTLAAGLAADAAPKQAPTVVPTAAPQSALTASPTLAAAPGAPGEGNRPAVELKARDAEIAKGDQSETTAHAVLRRPEFGRREAYVAYVPSLEPDKKAPMKPWTINDSWARILSSLGWVLEWVVIIVMAGALIFLGALLLSRALGNASWSWSLPDDVKRPKFIGGLDVRAESLPSDPVAEARRLIAANEARRALSLLYRACLVALIDRAQISFKRGDTEGLCLARASGRVPAPSYAYLRSLIDAWLVTAYARRPVSREVLEDLCLRWESSFGARASLHEQGAS